MISFLLGEGILTIGTISGLFTASLMNSLKINIIEPIFENIVETHSLDKHAKFGNIISPDKVQPPSNIIKYQTFIRDLLSWFMVIFILYLFWRFILNPYKLKNPNFGK